MQEGYAIWCLCILGFFKEFRPSEPFLTQYLEGPWKNLTQEEVNQEVYPIGTYSTLLTLIAVFLITDILCYKPVIIVHSTAGVACYCLLTFGTEKSYIQAAEVFYGLFLASEVAYSTYMYAACNRELYLKVTSYTRMALLAGRLLSAALSQLLISFELLNFHELNYLSLAGLSCSAVFGCILPSSKKSVYFHQELVENSKNIVESPLTCDDNLGPVPLQDSRLLQEADCLEVVRHPEALQSLQSSIAKSYTNTEQLSGFKKIRSDFMVSFSNLYIVKWSLWWALMQCGYLQVTSYVQNLWQDTVNISGENLYNGAASTTYTIAGILATCAVGQLRFALNERRSHWLLAACASISGTLVILSACSFTLFLQYVSYGIFKILYQVMMTLANSEVAKSLTQDSHGLVFGFNTFVALLLQTILTVTVTGKGGLELSTRVQFIVYGVIFIIIGIGFSFIAIATFIKDCFTQRQS